MRKHALDWMSCPYCGAAFRLATELEGSRDRIDYGFIECRCFAFPVVEGVLLLSLSKGYGGAEEDLQPYAPLQAAAVEYLRRGDVAGLRGWISRHIPFAARVLWGSPEPYLEFHSNFNLDMGAAVRRNLDAAAAYEVVGVRRPAHRRLARRAVSSLRRHGVLATPQLPGSGDFYAARFFSPRAMSLAFQLAAMPPAPRLLSLCCGHGVVENMLRAQNRVSDVVSIDGQFINLAVTRRYADHGGTYICHDVQHALPFRSEVFDGVVSSTCLPEIPTQHGFASEAIRVTGDGGWTLFDSIWNTDVPGVERVDPTRYYRFNQNFFSDISDYIPFFEECARGRRIGVDVPDVPAAYLAGPRWSFGDDIATAIANRADPYISVIVTGRDCDEIAAPDLGWVEPEALSVSYAFDVTHRGDRLELQRRPEYEQLHPTFAPASFAGYPGSASIDLDRIRERGYLCEQLAAGQLGLMPAEFDSEPTRRLASWIA